MPHKDPAARRAYARDLARRTRATARQAKRAELEVPWPGPVAEVAWAAGYFEGEGTVGLNSAGRGGYTVGRVSLTSVDRESIDWFQQRWGGVTRVRQMKQGQQTAYVWYLTGPSMYRFLWQVRPYLMRSKVQRRFDVAIEAYQTRIQGGKHPEVKARLMELRVEMLELNRRGVA